MKISENILATYASADCLVMGVYLAALSALAGSKHQGDLGEKNEENVRVNFKRFVVPTTISLITLGTSQIITLSSNVIIEAIIQITILLYLPNLITKILKPLLLSPKLQKYNGGNLTPTLEKIFYVTIALQPLVFTPSIFLHISLILLFHFLQTSCFYKILKNDKKILVASNAAVGGAGTAVGFAKTVDVDEESAGWVGCLGYVIGGGLSSIWLKFIT